MKPKLLYLVLLGSLGVLILGGLAAFIIGHKQLDQRIVKLNRLNSDLVIENQQIDRLKQLEARYNEVRPLAEKASSILPAQKEQDQVVAQISQIVIGHGLSLTGLTFDKTTGLPDEKSQTQASKIGGGGIFVMPVRFQTTGRFSQIQAMLSSFERQQRYMRVSTLDLSRTEDGQISAGAVLEVFFKP